jgi:hypothetical protein
VIEEIGEDGKLSAKIEHPDLAKLDSETLATLAGAVDPDTQQLLYDPKAKQVLSGAMPGAWAVDVDPLYYELARRTLLDNKDKDARQSFALALFKDPERTKQAKDLAFDDHSAELVIAQLEGGRQEARIDLQRLAEKGNRKARLYLGLDKPMARVDAGAPTGTAQSPAGGPASGSPTAASTPETAVQVSPTAAPSVPATPTK